MDKNEIKTHIIQNFLNCGYKYASVNIKKTIIADIIKQSWFPIEYGERTNTLCFYLCDGLTILIDCVWKESGDKFILSDFK